MWFVIEAGQTCINSDWSKHERGRFSELHSKNKPAL